jgi:hypothetical protein
VEGRVDDESVRVEKTAHLEDQGEEYETAQASPRPLGDGAVAPPARRAREQTKERLGYHNHYQSNQQGRQETWREYSDKETLHGDDGRTGQQKSTCGKSRYTRHEPDGADKEIEQEGAEEKTGQLAQRWDCEAHGHIDTGEVG